MRTTVQPRRRQMLNAHDMSVVDQIVLAFSRDNRLATIFGGVWGGIIPVATYLEVHVDWDPSRPLYILVVIAFIVAGGLLYSAKTVFAWAKRAFGDPWKAFGFVVLLEGVMVTSQVPVLPLVLLGILVATNGIATACTLSLDRARPRATPAAPRDTPWATATSPTAVAVPTPTSRKGARRVSTPAAPAVPENSRSLPAPVPQGRFSFAEGTDVN